MARESNHEYASAHDPLGLFDDREIKYQANKGINFSDISSEEQLIRDSNPDFIRIPVSGKGTTKEKKLANLKAQGALQEKYKNTKWEGEQEKTLEDHKFLQEANQILSTELKRLKLRIKANFSPEQLHFLDSVSFLHRTGNENIYGSATAGVQAAWFNKDRTILDYGKTNFMGTILHELIHLLSYLKINQESEDDLEHLSRIGYSEINRSANGLKMSLNGLNEAIVEKMARELLKQNQNELINVLGVELNDFAIEMPIYEIEREVLELILNRISQATEEPLHKVWDRFKRSEFTGQKMHLRQIEKYFGTGSLRVLSALGNETEKLTTDQIAVLVKQYFSSRDIKEKLSIIIELSDPKIQEKYLNKIENLVNQHGEVELEQLLRLISELQKQSDIEATTIN